MMLIFLIQSQSLLKATSYFLWSAQLSQMCPSFFHFFMSSFSIIILDSVWAGTTHLNILFSLINPYSSPENCIDVTSLFQSWRWISFIGISSHVLPSKLIHVTMYLCHFTHIIEKAKILSVDISRKSRIKQSNIHEVALKYSGQNITGECCHYWGGTVLEGTVLQEVMEREHPSTAVIKWFCLLIIVPTLLCSILDLLKINVYKYMWKSWRAVTAFEFSSKQE